MGAIVGERHVDAVEAMPCEQVRELRRDNEPRRAIAVARKGEIARLDGAESVLEQNDQGAFVRPIVRLE